VLHITEYLDQLIKEGKLKPKKNLPLQVTYHDPCRLGRLSEPRMPSLGKEYVVEGTTIQPMKEVPKARGFGGVFEPPREVIKSIPGINLVEMDRIKEYSWCCGAGGGVLEAYPDLALWTANERIEEAKATGAEAIVTACPWCERSFKDAVQETGQRMKVYDICELIQESI
jgi:Fe-S oxidoreductase